jgi:hypothetical protein
LANLEGTKVKKGINILEETLRENNGVDAIISISHKLYGDQKIRCVLDYIFDSERVGFRVKNGQEIFIYQSDIIDYGIKDGIYFADNLMEIKIKLNRAVK